MFLIDLLVNMDDLNYAQKAELNISGTKYGLSAGDFMNYLNADLEEKEEIRLAKLQEEEKQTMSVCEILFKILIFFGWARIQITFYYDFILSTFLGSQSSS